MPDLAESRTYRLPRGLAWLVYRVLDRVCVEHAVDAMPSFAYDEAPGEVVIRVEVQP